MRGRVVDMAKLAKKNELTPAAGNARVNARGDVLGPGGKIVRKREDVIKDHYNKNPSAVRDEASPSVKKPKADQPTVDLTSEEQEMFDEAAEQDEWIEDDEGNFVQKGE